MPGVNPLTDADRERIRQLHADGRSCSGIARELGRAPSTISRAAKAMGLSWDTTKTEQATQVKQASNRERRARLVSRLYDRAERIMDRLDADTFKYVGLDKDGRARTNHIDQDAIPGTEERALSGMTVNLLVAAAKLEAVDAGQANDAEARGILGNLQDALHAAYGQLAHAGGTPTAQALDQDLDATDTD